MSERPLLISAIIKHAAVYHRDTEIVSRTVEGAIYRYTYDAAERRAKRLARALLKLGIRPGDRVGILAWNTFRHFELYYAISGIGAVCHTINPRLFDNQIVYIINHAADRLLFVDTSFAPLIERLTPDLPTGCRIIWMTEEGAEPATGPSLPGLPSHEALISAEDEDFEWPEFDERMASSLCYTSGTTGNPKGVLYSHRSTVLHAFGISLPDGISISAADTVLPGGADVSCQRLGNSLCGTDAGRQARAARPTAGWPEPLSALRGGAGHARPWRADRVAPLRSIPLHNRRALLDPLPDSLGWLRGAAIDGRSFRRTRHRRKAGLGDDRDGPGGHDRGVEGQAPGPGSSGPDVGQGETGPAGFRSRDEDRRRCRAAPAS